MKTEIRIGLYLAISLFAWTEARGESSVTGEIDDSSLKVDGSEPGLGAEPNKSSNSVSALKAPLCSELSRASSLTTGLECMSSKGFVFERYINPKTKASGWLDTKAKIIWYDKIQGARNANVAKRFCSSIPGQRLPTSDFIDKDGDFSTAESHGIRELLNATSDVASLTGNHYLHSFFWSSTPFMTQDGKIDGRWTNVLYLKSGNIDTTPTDGGGLLGNPAGNVICVGEPETPAK